MQSDSFKTVARSRSARNSTATPPRIGSQMTRLRSGIGALTRSQTVDEVTEERTESDDHREGVMVEIAGLHLPYDAGEPPDETCRAVDHEPVDQTHIAELPERPARAARPAREDAVVEVVEPILADQEVVDHPEAIG